MRIPIRDKKIKKLNLNKCSIYQLVMLSAWKNATYVIQNGIVDSIEY